MSAVTMQLTVIADGNNIAYAVWAQMLTNVRKKSRASTFEGANAQSRAGRG